jgi:hypothetical protein
MPITVKFEFDKLTVIENNSEQYAKTWGDVENLLRQLQYTYKYCKIWHGKDYYEINMYENISYDRTIYGINCVKMKIYYRDINEHFTNTMTVLEGEQFTLSFCN